METTKDISKLNLLFRYLFFGFTDAWSYGMAGLFIGWGLQYLCAMYGYDRQWLFYTPAVILLAYRHGMLVYREVE